MYDALVSQTQAVLSRWAADATRREARLKAPTEDEDVEVQENQEYKSPRPPAKYGLDIDNEFRPSRPNLADRADAHKIVFEVLLDTAGIALRFAPSFPPLLNLCPHRTRTR